MLITVNGLLGNYKTARETEIFSFRNCRLDRGKKHNSCLIGIINTFIGTLSGVTFSVYGIIETKGKTLEEVKVLVK